MASVRPLKLWPFLLVGISSISIAKISLHPRLKLLKDEQGWTLRYDYLNRGNDIGPADKGIEIQPPRPHVTDRSAAASARSELNNTQWILDTGANSHMCTNRELMHAYTELAWGQTQRGFTGANGALDHHVGIGDCTLVPVLTDASGARRQAQPLTLQRIHYFPSTGVNLLSWSALKRGAAKQGLVLKMIERDDWSLDVCVVERSGRERAVMRFRPVMGLYVLDQATKDASVKTSSEEGQRKDKT